MKIEIEQLRVEDKEFGGKSCKSVNIRQGEDWYSTLDYDGWTSEFKEGEVIDVYVYEREGRDGRVFLNFKRLSGLAKDMEDMKNRLDALERKVNGDVSE